jgi:hypothetical protein
MENNGINNERREADRQALMMVTTLTERVSDVIKHFDDYRSKQEAMQIIVAAKLAEHEKLVIKGLTSWRWIALLSSIVAAGVVISYTEFMTLKESVLKHHAEWEIRKQYQDAINTKNEEQFKALMGTWRKDAK